MHPFTSVKHWDTIGFLLREKEKLWRKPKDTQLGGMGQKTVGFGGREMAQHAEQVTADIPPLKPESR